MPKRVAKVRQRYAERTIEAGDEFEVEPRHLMVLCAIGRIEPKRGDPGYIAPPAGAKAKAGRVAA